MRKGKFGVVLCLYPLLGFAAVILDQPLLCAAIFGFVVLAERDPWAGRQTLQALLLSMVVSGLRNVLVLGVNSLPTYLRFFYFLSLAASVVSGLIFLAGIVISIVAMVRVAREKEANLPLLAELAYRAYGQRRPAPQPPMPGQYPPPYGGQPPYPPYQGQAPYQPGYVPPQPVPPPHPAQNQGPQTGGSQTGGPQSGGPQQ